MAPPQKLGPLNDQEKAEFDHIRYDEIQECKDVKKLMRLEAYMRQEGFTPTADVAAGRLRELGQRAANSELDPEQARLQAQEQARARADIAAWTAKQRQTDAALGAANKRVLGGGSALDEVMPPIRAPVQSEPAGAKPPAPAPAASQQPAKPKTDSAVGTSVRSGREYYELWDKKVEAALAQADQDDNGATAGAPRVAAAAASTAGLVRSPELTARLLELNRGRSTAERLYLSGSEKTKGNDHFRAKEYAEAVEHYTLALGLRGHAGEPSLFNNRAAAYLKLKMWDAAEQDTTAALEADPALLKAYIRRAAARLEMGKLGECVADCDAALGLQPGCKDAEELRARAVKLLPDSGMKRMAIEEVEDEEDGEGEGEGPAGKASAAQDPAPASRAQQQQAQKPSEAAAAAPAASAGRKKLIVVEESDSEDSEEDRGGEGGTAAPATSTERLVHPEPPAAASPAPPPQAPDSPKPPARGSAAPVSADGSTSAVRGAEGSTPVQAAAPTAPPPKAAPEPGPAPAREAPAAVTNSESDESAAGAAAAGAPPPPLAQPAVRTPAVPQPRPPPPPKVETPPAPTPPEPTPIAKFDAAVDAIKLEGNNEFKKGNFVRAAQLYSDALALAPDSAVLYLNRSMARLSSELYPEALQDACLAVALDPTSYKALNKRARAKEKLRLWEGARDDMQSCLDLIPPKDKAHGDVERELQRAEANLEGAKKRAVERAAAAAARGPQRVTNYARARVTIEEHHDEAEECEEDKPLVTPEQAEEWEAAAVRRLPALRRRAGETCELWLRQRDAEAREAYQRELLSWEAAKERAEAAAAAAAAAAEEAAAAAAADEAAEAAAAAAAVPAPAAVPEPSSRSVEAIKNEGNEHLKAKRYQQAEECYRECLRLDPDNVAVRLNLLVLLNATERWTEAEAGADKALTLLAAGQGALTPDQQYNMRSKVFHRRALARKAMGRLLEARDDLRAAKSLMGQSAQLDEELEAIGKLIAAEREAAAVATAPAAAAPPAAAATSEGPSLAALSTATEAASSASSAAEANAEALPPAPAGGAAEEPVPARPAAQATAEPTGPAPAPAPTTATSSSTGSSTVGGGAGSAAPPARRRMAVQVESDDSDEEELSQRPVAPAAATTTASAPARSPLQPQTQPPPVVARAPVPTPTLAVSSTQGQPADTPGPAPAPAAPAPAPATTGPAAVAAPAAAHAAAASASASSSAAPSAKVNGLREVSGDPGNPEEAARLRDEGNRLYGVGNYVRAMDFYSRSIRACAHNPAAYCNRAFVYLHLKRPADALLDAEAAIEQAGGKYPKAQLRRALALRELGRISEAMTAVRQLLDAAPGDEALLEEMQRLQRIAAEGAAGKGAMPAPVQAQAAKPVANGLAAAQPQPAQVQVQVQAPPVRHKIVVEEASSDSEDGDQGEEISGNVTAPAVAAAAAAATAADAGPGTGTASIRTPSAPEASAAEASTPTAAVANGGPGSAATGSVSPAAAPVQASAEAAGAGAASAGPADGKGTVPAAAAARGLQEASAKAAAALAVAGKTPKKPKPPKNAHELEQALKTLAGHPAVQYDYIRSLDPASYAGVIKANLSVKMIQAIVDAARQALGNPGSGVVEPAPKREDVEFALRSLESLTLVPRFDMTYGLCGKGIKDDMRVLVVALVAAGQDVSLLKKSYKL